MEENCISSDMNAPIDDLHRDCLEAIAMIRRKHAVSRFKLGLDLLVEDAPVESSAFLERLSQTESFDSQKKRM